VDWKKVLLSGTACTIVLANTVSGETSIHYTLDGAALEERGQLKQLIYTPSETKITLKDMVLVEDDAPAVGRPEGATDRSWFEKLHKGIKIRKELPLDDPRAFSGYLVFNGFEKENNTHPLHISINGCHFLRPPTKRIHPFAKQYYTREWGGDQFDNWFFVEIPTGALRKGINEIILWADSEETSWEIMVADDREYARGSDTRTHHPNRSAKSSDGGVTWDDERLGWKGAHDGEYCIRLSLDRYVPEGEYLSPVIDLAEEYGKASIKKLVSLRECTVTWDIDVPERSEAVVLVRFGRSLVPTSEEWTPFEETDGISMRWENPSGRYLQFKVVMRTSNPLVSPALRGLSVHSIVEDVPAEPALFTRIVEFRNGRVIRPSVEYTHEDFSRLKEFRERFELDRVVAGAKTEFEAQLKLMRWAYEIPIDRLNPYSWDYYDLPVLKRDADGNIVLQKEYEGRRRDKHCLYCNLTLVGACLAMGYPARWVNIATRTTYGHEVAEVWSNEFNKWIFLDATRDYYIYDPETGIPMSLIEINERLKEIVPRPPNWEYPVRWMIPSDSLAYAVRVAFREGDNRFSIRDVRQGPHLLLLKGQLHLPLRNDFASRHTPVPWRLSSNWGGDLFYGYYNDTFPRKREYSLHTNRRQDFNPPLNQSELTLSETAAPGILRVDVDTETPCFGTFLVSMDGGEWFENPGSSFEWPLHEGLNTLRVKARNTAGVCGPESYVSVVADK